ncbi:glycosyltransferase 6-like [Euphorbia lathyris]|uniref:glycosyltransferase 6-like n=1 Tax=Euphorbia lathyris TaxID=212925 RepID=UPI003313527F
MTKLGFRIKPTDSFVYVCAFLFAFALICSFWSYAPTNIPLIRNHDRLNRLRSNFTHPNCPPNPPINLRSDPPNRTFYDDPHLSYSIEKPIKNWDRKRKEWFKHHPSFAAGAIDRVLVVTGSQPTPCQNPKGDHLLLRLFKNKVDYCRIHGYDIFYNNVLLHPKMNSFWAKLPVVKAAMLAHPEAEWIWWIDADALFTDMDFKLPLRRYDYKHHNMVVHGWGHLIYEDKSWTALNAGVFLIRNCQWSMDFMYKWANMGPISPDYHKWGPIQKSIFKDKLFPESDDQTALIYMLYEDKSLTEKIYLEGEYYFEAYWLGIVKTYNNVSEMYAETERDDVKLRRRHAEKVSEQYGEFREPHLKEAGIGKGGWRRPFITHFTGCQPCNGEHNPMYKGDSCLKGMIRALNFADNQILRNYGFVHPDLKDTNRVVETPFDYPERGAY